MNRTSRIVKGVTRSEPVAITFDGKNIEAHAGESVAAALMTAGIFSLRNAPVDGGGRGVFCAMGICQECIVQVDGKRSEACRLTVRDGMTIHRVTYG